MTQMTIAEIMNELACCGVDADVYPNWALLRCSLFLDIGNSELRLMRENGYVLTRIFYDDGICAYFRREEVRA